MSTPYILYGAEVSYYAAKIRACLRYKGVPFEERLATRAVFTENILPRVGWPVIPVLITPQDETVQDTSDMVDLLEARHPEPVVIPAAPLARALSYLLELIGDEWLKMPAMHYRWNYNNDFCIAEFGRNNDPDKPLAEQHRIGEKIAVRFRGWLDPLGVNAATIPAIEADYLETLALLDTHFAVQPFLLGTQPTLGDFAFFGPLYAHLCRDPASGVILRAHAPRVLGWIERLRAGVAPGPTPAPDRVPPTLRALLRHLLRDFVPILVNEVGALQRWLADHDETQELPRHFGTHSVVLGRGTPRQMITERALISYDQWMLQRLLDAVAATPPAARADVEAALADCGAAPLLTIRLTTRLARHDFKLVRAAA